MKVNLFDRAFAHVPFSVPGRTSKHIQWVRDQPKWDGVTIVTDQMLLSGMPFQSRITIGWLLEGRAYGKVYYDSIPHLIHKLDLLLTHDAALLQAYPEKARFVPFGGCWIPDDKWGMHPKTKLLSMIYSYKNFMPGHRLRHQVARRIQHHEGVELFGTGAGKPITCKTEGLNDFMFSVVIENDRAENYFTEKLIDCFATGTIPIYWGCPNIGDFFDVRGMLRMDDVTDWGSVALHLVHSNGMLEAAERNLITARKYVLAEDWIYEKVLIQL